MTKFITKQLPFLLILITVSNSSFARDSGFYGQIDVGYSKAKGSQNGDLSVYLPKTSISYAPIFGAEFGYQFINNLRTGLALYGANYRFERSNNATIKSFEFNVSSKEKIQTIALIVNGYYDFLNFEHFTPYLALGAGVAFNKSMSTLRAYYFSNIDYPRRDPITTKSAIKANLAWSFGSGLMIPISKSCYLNMALKYFDFGKSSTSDISVDNGIASIKKPISNKLSATSITIGLHYKL